MKNFFVILVAFLFILGLSFLKPTPILAGCDVQFCTTAECSQLRCNTCSFCLQCDDAFCTLAECTQQRCWGCSFCNPPRCDTQYCTAANCSETRCRDCSFCGASSGGCTCSVGYTRLCEKQTNNCSSGFIAQCTSDITKCNGSTGSCTCVVSSPGSDPTCGGQSQNCCPGGVCDTADLRCTTTQAGTFCLAKTQYCCLPGGPPPGADCTGFKCGTYGFGGFRPALCADGVSISTALGCIPVKDTQALTTFLLRWGIGIAGGTAFLLIIYAAFMIITSAGNPQKLQAGKELLTAAFVGLILLILSAFILRVIGKDILRIFP